MPPTENKELCEDLEEFTTKRGRHLYLIEFRKPNLLYAWEDMGKEYSINTLMPRLINVDRVSISSLKDIKVWDKLSKNVKDDIQTLKIEEGNYVNSKMEKARKSRTKKYPNIPREIICIECTKIIKVVPSIIAKRIEKTDVTIENFVSNFKCRECSPVKRGRAKNPKFANYPSELVCKCGNRTKVAASNLDAKAKLKGISVDELVKEYVCQKCCPRKRGRFGKAKNPKFKDYPDELVCKCGNKVKVGASNLNARAKLKGISVKDFVKGYVCQKCFSTRGRKKGWKKKK